jgi:hypothetical protein
LLATFGLAAVASLGIAMVYAHERAAPSCESELAMGQVYGILRDRFQLDSILLNNIHAASGGVFSKDRECLAEVTEIRGNVNASDMLWREVRYSIARGSLSARPAVTVALGSTVPLAAPRPPLWKRLLGLL